MNKIKTMATVGFVKSRGIKSISDRVNKLYQELYGTVQTTLVKKYHLGITHTAPYVKDVVFTTTTTEAVYSSSTDPVTLVTTTTLVSPASTTTTATKVMGNLIFQDGVLTETN